MFSKDYIASYYDLSETHYRFFWDLKKSKSLHYGFWDASTKNFHEALFNTNKVLAIKVKITKDDYVLDAGCGVGGSSIWLAKNIGCKVLGITLSDKQVGSANAFAQKENIDHLVTFQKKDFTSTGFKDETFNVVWGLESVCHANDKSLFIKEAYRILKPNGILIIADFFKKDNLKGNDASQIERWAHGWAIEDFATKNNFQLQLAAAGFTHVCFKNNNASILPSAKRLYYAYFFGIIPAFFYRIFNRKTTILAKNNVDTARLQYQTLKKGLWDYEIVCAQKIFPSDSLVH